MPEICRFFGMVVFMFYNDHPPPHFHVRYGDQRAIIDIRSLAVLQGRLTPKALALVTEWAALHQSELLAVWDQARTGQPLARIAPLE